MSFHFILFFLTSALLEAHSYAFELLGIALKHCSVDKLQCIHLFTYFVQFSQYTMWRVAFLCYYQCTICLELWFVKKGLTLITQYRMSLTLISKLTLYNLEVKYERRAYGNYSMEGLHDVVPARFCPAPWFPFCMAWYGEKTTKPAFLLIYFIARFEFSTDCVF